MLKPVAHTKSSFVKTSNAFQLQIFSFNKIRNRPFYRRALQYLKERAVDVVAQKFMCSTFLCSFFRVKRSLEARFTVFACLINVWIGRKTKWKKRRIHTATFTRVRCCCRSIFSIKRTITNELKMAHLADRSDNHFEQWQIDKTDKNIRLPYFDQCQSKCMSFWFWFLFLNKHK